MANKTPEEKFRAFQSNLLSLISHELRTPLTGILNSISLLESADEAVPNRELIEIAARNARRLHHSLSSLLDLAAIENGTFFPRMREIELSRVVTAALQDFSAMGPDILKERKISLSHHASSLNEGREEPLLADPQKLARAIGLVILLAAQNAREGSEITLALAGSQIDFNFQLDPLLLSGWKNAWDRTDFAPTAFTPVAQGESGFLSRSQEGLGSEIALIREILKAQQGEFKKSEPLGRGKPVKPSDAVTLSLVLPRLSSYERLRVVISSRVYESSTGLGSVALVLLAVPKSLEIAVFQQRIRECLFRSSDAVYSLPDKKQLAVVLNDCKPGDAPGLLSRIERKLQLPLKFGWVTCPEEGTDPELLIRLAEHRLTP